jgi:hypothetical protein
MGHPQDHEFHHGQDNWATTGTDSGSRLVQPLVSALGQLQGATESKGLCCGSESDFSSLSLSFNIC